MNKAVITLTEAGVDSMVRLKAINDCLKIAIDEEKKNELP